MTWCGIRIDTPWHRRSTTSRLTLEDLLLAHCDGPSEPVLLARQRQVFAGHRRGRALAVLHREAEVLAGSEMARVRLPHVPLFAGGAAAAGEECGAEHE